MFKPTRWLAVLSAVVLVAALGASALAAPSTPKPKGHKDGGFVYAGIARTVGNIDYIAGVGSDNKLGPGAVTFKSKVTPGTPGTVKLTINPVIFFYKSGSLSGKSNATLVIGAGGAVTITGKINETSGAGAEKGHTFVGTLKGSAKSVAGPFVFTYTGTYK